MVILELVINLLANGTFLSKSSMNVYHVRLHIVQIRLSILVSNQRRPLPEVQNMDISGPTYVLQIFLKKVINVPSYISIRFPIQDPYVITDKVVSILFRQLFLYK